MTRQGGLNATALSAALVLAAVVGGCTDDRGFVPPGRTPPAPALAEPALRRAQDCDDLATSATEVLTRAVAPQDPAGMDDAVAATGPADGRGGGDADSAGAAPPTTAALAEELAPSPAEREVVGTNNQEQAVDEADLVKTDGERLVTLVGGVLSVVVLDEDPEVDGVLALTDGPADQMFLRGDTALLIGSSSEPVPMLGERGPVLRERGPIGTEPGPGLPGPTTLVTPPDTTPFGSATSLTLVSLADPAAPVVLDRADVEGSVVAARQVGTTARVVLRSTPAVAPQAFSTGDVDGARTASEVLDGTDLLPRVRADGVVRPLGGCDDVSVSAVAAGADDSWTSTPELATVTVLTIGEDLDELAPVSVQGAVQAVYASADAVHTTSSSWSANGSSTVVHRFGIRGEGPATYQGSGVLPGQLLDQFSLSEHDGVLRAVTLLDHGMSEARVTTLDTEGDTLDELGHVDGMGRGEQVQSVRFLGDRAYVVTFRQVDPLYAVDLADPAAPRVLGELKIPGFSEYLHPVGEGLLVGVGRQVDPDSGVDVGLKVSLFDVSDPLAMAEVDQLVLPGATSEVSADHKAFTWDPARRQMVLPVEQLTACGPTGAEIGCAPSGAALVLRVEGRELRRVAELRHETGGLRLQPTRSVVVDDDLWTVSVAAIGRSDADEPTAVELLAPA